MELERHRARERKDVKIERQIEQERERDARETECKIERH